MKNMDGALGPTDSNNFTNEQKGVMSSDKAHKYHRVIEFKGFSTTNKYTSKRKNRRSKTH